MEASVALPTLPNIERQLEDPLAHLPYSTILDYPKGRMIYNQDQSSSGLYLVMEGRVVVSRLADKGHQIVLDIYHADDFFGETVFLNLPHRTEQATALENARLMTWSAPALEEILLRRPRLGVALVQMLVQ